MLSAIGLLLDIIGAGLIFFFGVIPKMYADGRQGVTWREPTELEAAKGSRYARLSQLGIGLLIAGFVFQIAGNDYVQNMNW